MAEGSPAKSCRVQASLIKGADVACSMTWQIVQDNDNNSAGTLPMFIGLKSASWLLADPTFKIELALISNLARHDKTCLLTTGHLSRER